MTGSKARIVRVFAILILASVILVSILILSGLFDPGPHGDLAWKQERIVLDIAALSEDMRFLGAYPTNSDTSLTLTSRAAAGELDIGYGIALSNEEDMMVIAVSPLGYAAIWEAGSTPNSPGAEYLLPWQTWPHIRSGRQENEIQLSILENILTVRMNHELLWQGAIQGQFDSVNLYGVSYGKEAAVEARSIELFVQ